jgi:hypothetical protein
MAINEQLLKKVHAAAAGLVQAEQQVDLAREQLHALVRRMHLAGGSLREIAQALDLSHQRVQQMVHGAGGSWWQRAWRGRNLNGNLACTFCKAPQDRVARLIAGPKIFICDSCVELAERGLTAASAASACGSLELAGKTTKVRCSFCGKRRAADRPILTCPDANICMDCLHVCRQIFLDSLP